jgi:hypothetical protein
MIESTDKLTLQFLSIANSYWRERLNLICINRFNLEIHTNDVVCLQSHCILGTVEEVFAPIVAKIEAGDQQEIKAFCEKLAESLAKLKTPILERRITL